MLKSRKKKTVSQMKETKLLLLIVSLSLTLLSAAGCSGRPVSAAQASAVADELDPANKAVATDLRNKMAEHAR